MRYILAGENQHQIREKRRSICESACLINPHLNKQPGKTTPVTLLYINYYYYCNREIVAGGYVASKGAIIHSNVLLSRRDSMNNMDGFLIPDNNSIVVIRGFASVEDSVISIHVLSVEDRSAHQQKSKLQ